MEYLLLIFLILLNAYFSASEIALVSLNDAKINAQAEDGDHKASLMIKLLKKPTKFLATIQIGVTLAGFLASAIASVTFVEQFKNILPASWGGAAEPISVAVITIILSLVTLIFGELVPKRLALNRPEGFARSTISLLNIVSHVFAPLVWFLSISANLCLRIFGVNPDESPNHITEEEIRLMVDVGEEKGEIEKVEKEFINNIFNFSDMDVSDIMTHRTEIVGLPVTATLDEVITVASEELFSRLPVYEENIDNIIGVLHVKDLLPLLSNRPMKFSLRKLLRPPFFVPESRQPQDLLKDMKRTKSHIAIVIDEYGGTAGIVTIEDLLEEIVGNIFDEYDEDEVQYEKIDEKNYIFDGSMDFDDFSELMDFEPPEEDEDEYETLSGFIIGHLGRIPREDEKPEIRIYDMQFCVLEIDEKKINKVRVTKLPPESEENTSKELDNE